jgi:O-antigen ligase
LPPPPIIIDPDKLPTAGRQWEQILGGIFIALLAFMPAAFGAVEAWSELVVVLAAAALSLGLAARFIFDRDFRFTRSWLYIPLAIFATVVAFQLVSIPASFVRAIASSTVQTREDLLGKVFSPDQTTTLSFYPLSTAEHLRLVLIGLSVFAVVSCCFRRTQHIKILLIAIFVIGCAEAVLSLAQIATGSGSIYWYYTVKQGVHTSGTFINYSNFSQFMNLSLGAGLALLLVRVEEQRRNEIQSGHWGSLVRNSWEKNAWVYVGLILCALAVFSSMSRNGAISMLVAAALTGALIFQRGAVSKRGWFLAALPLAVFAALLIFGFDTVYDRLATVRNNESYGLRWEMTEAAFRAWQQYPIWGTGLGTHEFIAPMFETSATPVIAAHADNEYAQLLEETGIFGCAAAAIVLCGVAALIGRLAFRGRKPISVAVYGIMFGLIAVAIHSATDFGQRLPANLVLSATFCGLLVAIARGESPRPGVRHGSNPEPWRRPRS